MRRVALKSVKFLYVHVEIQNTSALRCYESFGFSEEKKESELVAINLGRPPRKLLFVRRARRGGVRFVKRRTVYIGDGKFICEMRIHSNR